jgi:hypothetical protein
MKESHVIVGHCCNCASQEVTIMSSPIGDILPKLSGDTHHIVHNRDTGSKFLF